MKGEPADRKLIREIVEKIVGGYAPEKIILFGSHAYGTPNEDSDVDLLVIKETPDRFLDRWAALRGLLSDPNRRLPLETVILTPAEVEQRLARGDQFMQEIMIRGQVLYAA